MAVKGSKVTEFVNDFVYEYLSRDIEFSDVYEADEAQDFSRKQQLKAHDEIHALLKRIRKEIYGS
jgi:hypothetical protein